VRFEKRTGKSRKPDDSGATFGTVGGPVAVDAERRNSAVGRGDASATRPENFVPIGRAVRTPGTLARDHPSGEATKRPIDAGRRRTLRRRGTDARNSRQYGARRVGETEQKKKSRKSAKAFESYRRFGERLKVGSFEDVRPHARDGGHAQRHRTAAVVAAASDGGGAVGRTSVYGAGGGRFDSADVLLFLFFAVEVCDESEISQTHRQSLAAAAVGLFKYSASN
jgi:hypothetical protein